MIINNARQGARPNSKVPIKWAVKFETGDPLPAGSTGAAPQGR